MLCALWKNPREAGLGTNTLGFIPDQVRCQSNYLSSLRTKLINIRHNTQLSQFGDS